MVPEIKDVLRKEGGLQAVPENRGILGKRDGTS